VLPSPNRREVNVTSLFVRRRLWARASRVVSATLAGCSGRFDVDRGGLSVDPDPIVIVPGDGDDGRHRRPAQAYDIPPGRQPAPGACDVHVPSGAVLVRG
jgi:hypothetical protein